MVQWSLAISMLFDSNTPLMSMLNRKSSHDSGTKNIIAIVRQDVLKCDILVCE